jgi:hypothetical protein
MLDVAAVLGERSGFGVRCGQEFSPVRSVLRQRVPPPGSPALLSGSHGNDVCTF